MKRPTLYILRWPNETGETYPFAFIIAVSDKDAKQWAEDHFPVPPTALAEIDPKDATGMNPFDCPYPATKAAMGLRK